MINNELRVKLVESGLSASEANALVRRAALDIVLKSWFFVQIIYSILFPVTLFYLIFLLLYSIDVGLYIKLTVNHFMLYGYAVSVMFTFYLLRNATKRFEILLREKIIDGIAKVIIS